MYSVFILFPHTRQVRFGSDVETGNDVLDLEHIRHVAQHQGQQPRLTGDLRALEGHLHPEQLAALPPGQPFEALRALRGGLLQPPRAVGRRVGAGAEADDVETVLGYYVDGKPVEGAVVMTMLEGSEQAPRAVGTDALIVGLENATHFCQWTIAATPGHPALKHVAAVVLKNFESRGIDLMHEHFVHATTGPAIWTGALREYLGADGDLNAGQIYQRHRKDPAFRKSCRQRGVFLMDDRFFAGKMVLHEYGSQRFRDYDRWPALADQLRARRPAP